MSKEVLSSPANDAVGELEQQVSIQYVRKMLNTIPYFAN